MITLLLLFISFSRADESVPVVSVDTFQPNKAWTWSYFTKDKQFYSSERYQVLSVSGNKVVLEMASRYKPNEPLRAHHRLHVDVQKCLNAYKKPGVKTGWAFQMYYWNGTYWDSAGNVPTAAFEEKFNCNPHVLKTKNAETLFKLSDPALGSVALFQQQKNKRVTGSWFFLEGENAGIAAERISAEEDSRFGYQLLFQGVSAVTESTPTY